MVDVAELIQKGEQPVLVDFYRPGCRPCDTILPMLEELDQKMGDKLRIVKVDIQQNVEAATSLMIKGVPTLMLFKNGEAVWQQIGAESAAQLEEKVEAFL